MDTKYCAKCEKTLPLAEFGSRSSGGYQSACKSCRAAYAAVWYKNNKKVHYRRTRISNGKTRELNRRTTVEYLRNHPCVDCGEPDIVVLDFDHRPQTDKKHDVSNMLASYSWERIHEEIKKCDVRCANCHRRVTAARQKTWRWQYSIAGK